MVESEELPLLRDELSLSNANSFWGAYTAAVLASLGVGTVVISPGSRSTPLTFAFARQSGLHCISVLDERSAAFIALGAARASGKPSVLVCTSGSAAAHYLPAVIEARESGIPLLILTADRPPEARFCRSGQTIDQQKIFGDFVCFYTEWPLPAGNPELLRYLRQSLVSAIARSQAPDGGPVHINCPFRDPLSPSPTPNGTSAFPLETFPASLWVAPLPESTARLISDDFPVLPTPVLLVAGAAEVKDRLVYAHSAFALAEKLQAPVLADVLSPLRHHSDACATVLVTTYESILRRMALTQVEGLPPDVGSVLVLDELPTSKTLRLWLATLDVPFFWLTERVDNRDPLHSRGTHLRGSAQDLLCHWDANGKVPGVHPASQNALQWWSRQQSSHSTRLNECFDEKRSRRLRPIEPELIPVLAAAASLFDIVHIASSMPVRDAEYFWPGNSSHSRVLANRGANGIDGTLSTAVGYAACRQSVLLLVGDLAFLHDGNALLSARHCRATVTVVLVNNRGGGIFGHLPIASFQPPFEEFFATPQSVDVGRLCRAYGIEHERVTSAEHLSQMLHPDGSCGIRVLEVACERNEAIQFRKEVL